jgi:ABC-type transport system involved in Fe-S cluster assembly fused permease/ATPase subunit
MLWLAIDKGAIAFKDVHFAYDPARPILKGISFEVPAGKTVAIVGPSGAGKSTISRLLYRFYDVQQGAITIDGQDVRRDAGEPARRRSAWCRRTPCCSTTPSPTTSAMAALLRREEEVEAAADIAQIGGFIERCPKATRRWSASAG